LDILINDIGLDQIKACVKRPLAGLNVAPLLRLSNCSALRHLRSDVLPGFNG
jgi:heterodisulfide reductase subunit B